MGEHQITQDPDPLGPVIKRKASKVIVHEDWKKGSRPYYNDIALIRLDQKIDLEQLTKPICLPWNYDLDLESGQDLTITGWGRTFEGQDRLEEGSAIYSQDTLLKATLKLSSDKECLDRYHSGRGTPYNKETQICARDSSGNIRFNLI